MMKDESRVVENFLEAFNARDIDAIMTFFAPDAVYHNMPIEPVRGADAIRSMIEMFVGPAERVDWETVHIAQIGKTVLTERIDRFIINGNAVELPVMGAFDVEDDRIVAWRDYFDMSTWQRQMGGAA